MPSTVTDTSELSACRNAPDPRADPCLHRYLKNLAALYRADPELAAAIDAMPFSACPTLETARDGNLTAQVTSDQGKPIYLHSRHRPLEETRRLVDAVLNGSEDQQSTPGPLSFVLCGLGLGYALSELQKRCHRPLIVVIEDDLATLKAALCLHDLSEPIADGRLVFLASTDKARLHARLQPVQAELLLGLRYLALPHTSRRHSGFYRDARNRFQDYLAYARLQMVTLLRNARVTYRNVLYNLPAYLERPGVEVLEGRAKGWPAVIVAAGPSLARNIDLLVQLRGRVVLIAVQTVFKHLLERGIPPHFVTSLDFHELSARFFHGVQDPGDTILVAEPKVSWRVLETFPGRTHLVHNELYDQLLLEAAPRRGRIRPGSTVAHLAFYLAEYLGCDPIILVGQDLSFSEGLYYPPGMPIEQLWQPELDRFCTVEMKQWERIVRARPILRKVKDIHGRDTYTDEQLFTYAEQFQRDFAASPARIIHACEGGMRLSGTEVMTLRDAAERFGNRTLPPDLFAAGAGFEPPELRRRALAALEARREELREVTRIAQEMRGLLLRLMDLCDQPTAFNRLIVRVDDLRLHIRRYDRMYKIVVGASQLAELRRYSADRRLRRHERETPEVARRRLRRDLEFVDGFLDGCAFLEEVLPVTMERLRESSA